MIAVIHVWIPFAMFPPQADLNGNGTLDEDEFSRLLVSALGTNRATRVTSVHMRVSDPSRN